MARKRITLAFSGGLDTSFVLLSLVEQGCEVTTVTVNTGGFSPDELSDIELRARAIGAHDHVVIDGRRRLYDEFLVYIIKANYLRNGVYPSCVGIERMLQAEEVARFALGSGADAIAHGSTGAGNDHVRFDAVCKVVAPELEIIATIRDQQHTREEEQAYLRSQGHPVSEIAAKYSFNFGVLGTTIGGEETYGSWDYLPEEAWPATRPISEAPDEAQDLTIRFEQGLPVRCEIADGILLDPGEASVGVPGFDILSALNRLGGEHGYGRGIHTGSTIMGIVGRLGFEAPGALLLIAAHRELERLVLTNRQQAMKASIGTVLGDLLHEGLFYEPLLDDLRAFIDSSQTIVTGDVRVRLHKGSATVLGCRSAYSLLAGSRALGSTYGHDSSLWTGEDARGFARIYAVAGLLSHSTRQAQDR